MMSVVMSSDIEHDPKNLILQSQSISEMKKESEANTSRERIDSIEFQDKTDEFHDPY